MKVLKKALIFGLLAIAIVLPSVGIILLNSDSTQEQFYVGVTYCGDSVIEAKKLIDKVKNYTNLFVLQSGTLQYGHRLDELRQIIDYAVESDLYFIVYLSQFQEHLDDWFGLFDPLWANHFLGVYFGDEPGGKMVDGYTNFLKGSSKNIIEKWADGSVKVNFANLPPNIEYDPEITYYHNGTVFVKKYDLNDGLKIIYATYYINGTVSVKIEELVGSSFQHGSETDIPYSYETVQNMYPFNNYDVAADLFIDLYRSILTNETNGYSDATYFTSDYVLHWFDYKSGYDVILAQVGWNHTIEQDIALVRGAARMQDKKWGAIITWKYNHPPYLDSGEAIFDQMKISYEAGAEYVVLFNYAENITTPYDTLQEEHFVALEQFWNEVVQNLDVKQGSIKADAVLVLPENYGWGMRDPNDKIWGLWGPDEKSSQIWSTSQSLLEQYGLGLDIIYEDSQFPFEEKYSKIFYWNQTP